MQFNLCSCMGKVGDDPYCPCEMERRGLKPTNIWTDEKLKELNSVLGEIFKWRKEDGINSDNSQQPSRSAKD